MEILYTGFKGKHNSSYRLVNGLKGNKIYLTNSFGGLKKDIENINKEFDVVYMFGLDKNLSDSVRIEKCAKKDSKLIYTIIDMNNVSKMFGSSWNRELNIRNTNCLFM